MLIELAFLGIFCFFLLQYWKRKDLPPGPFQWPILGNTIALARANINFPYLAQHELSKGYGPLMSLKLGVHDCVLVSSYEAVKEIFSHDNFAARYKFAYINARAYNKELGIGFSNGEAHQEIRKFTTKNLREFGFGKPHSMELMICEEIAEIMDMMTKTVTNNEGKLEICCRYFALSSVNVIWSMITGDRFQHGDPMLNSILDTSDKFMDTVQLDNLTIPFPILGKLFPKWSGWEQNLKIYEKLYKFTEAQIDQKEVNIEDPQNFLDIFHREIEKNKDNPNSYFTKQNLVITVQDLFLASSETNANVICYFLLYVTLHPETQRKLQKEIDEIIPRHVTPDLETVKKMPYMQAAITETLRLGNIAPQVTMRMAIEDYTYKGYKIPKGTGVLNNNHGILMDKDYWKDPEAFRPERFIDENGNFVNDERVAAFGYGKRRICPGDTLARTFLFLYFATLLQKFTFELDPNEPVPTMESRKSFVLGPYPFKVKLGIRT